MANRSVRVVMMNSPSQIPNSKTVLRADHVLWMEEKDTTRNVEEEELNSSTSLPGEEAAGSSVSNVQFSYSPSQHTYHLLEESWQCYQDRSGLWQRHLLPCNWVAIPMQAPGAMGVHTA